MSTLVKLKLKSILFINHIFAGSLINYAKRK